jgi:2-keto-3-deoxy-6-phosphogluconate aldolase
VFRVREQLGVEIGLRVLFERPRLEDLALAVQAAQVSDIDASGPPLTHLPRERFQARRDAGGALEVSPELRAELVKLAGE